MTECAGPERTSKGMEKGHEIVKAIAEKYENAELDSTDAYEICNMSLTADAVFTAARARSESIGAHYIID